MEKFTLSIPTMFADHHVLAVRSALEIPGIDQVYASAAWKQVLITYDPESITEEQIQAALEKGGYPVDGKDTPILVQHAKSGRDPQWETSPSRHTKTHAAEKQLSGN